MQNEKEKLPKPEYHSREFSGFCSGGAWESTRPTLDVSQCSRNAHVPTTLFTASSRTSDLNPAGPAQGPGGNWHPCPSPLSPFHLHSSGEQRGLWGSCLVDEESRHIVWVFIWKGGWILIMYTVGTCPVGTASPIVPTCFRGQTSLQRAELQAP